MGEKKKARECSGGIKINTDNDAFDNNMRVAVTWRCGRITGCHSADRIYRRYQLQNTLFFKRISARGCDTNPASSSHSCDAVGPGGTLGKDSFWCPGCREPYLLPQTFPFPANKHKIPSPQLFHTNYSCHQRGPHSTSYPGPAAIILMSILCVWL